MAAWASARTRCGLLSAGLLLFAACSPARAVWSRPGTVDWEALQRGLAEERDARPRDRWAAVVRVTMREPRTGHVVDGRGGIAVAPGRAVRMILVGGAGLTLMDLWVTPERWRVLVPPIDVVRRGTTSDDPADLPVGFLRWWFFTPLEGSLSAATRSDAGPLWLLRDGDAVIELGRSPCEGGRRLLTVTRRTHGRREMVRECRASAAQAGDWVEYKDEGSGLAVHLVVESVGTEPPPDAAFGDPEEARGGT